MTWQSNIVVDQMAREAELRRRVRALNRHVLGVPGKSRPRQLRVVLVLTVLFAVALGIWTGASLQVAVDPDTVRPDHSLDDRTEWPMLLTGAVIKLSGAALLAVCVLKRLWLPAALNMAFVMACVIATGVGASDLQGPEPGDAPSPEPAEVPER